jgi:hypothetical protein
MHKSGNIAGWRTFRKWHFFVAIQQKNCRWSLAQFVPIADGDWLHFMCYHSVPMQTGPANFIEFKVGKTNAAGQLDAFDEAEHIHPNFNGQKNDFPKIKRNTLFTLKYTIFGH